MEAKKIARTIPSVLLICVLFLAQITIVSCRKIQDPLASVSVDAPSSAYSEGDGTDSQSIYGRAGQATVASMALRAPSVFFYKGYYYPYNWHYVDQTASGLNTFMKYNLSTGEESPVCLDPMCKHKEYKFPNEATCPFGYGAKPFAISDDTVYYSTEIAVNRDTYYETKVYSYSLKNMRQIYLFSYTDGVLGNDVLNMIGNRIYYGDYDVHDDLSADRYFCVYDLSSGKSERLFKYNSFNKPETGRLNQIPTETDLNLMFVDQNERVFLHDKTTVYVAKAEKDAKMQKIADLSEYEDVGFGGHLREDKLYFLAGSDRPQKILCVDCASGEVDVIADDVVLDFTMYGDFLCYWLYEPIDVGSTDFGSTSLATHSIVVMDLKNGTSKTVVFDYENGFPLTLSGLLFYDGKICLPGATRLFLQDGKWNGDTAQGLYVFDLESGEWYAFVEKVYVAMH